MVAGRQRCSSWKCNSLPCRALNPFRKWSECDAAIRVRAERVIQAYKLHFIDRWTGSIRSFVGFEAASDEEASDHAAAFLGADIVELWCGSRLVHRFPS